MLATANVGCMIQLPAGLAQRGLKTPGQARNGVARRGICEQL